MNRIAGVGDDYDISRGCDRLCHIGESFFRAQRGDDLGFRIELYAETTRVVGRLRAPQSRNPARGRITVRAGLPERIFELLDDVRRRRQVGIPHPEVDDVTAGVARCRLGAIDLLEDVGRQAPNAVKFFHGPGSLAYAPMTREEAEPSITAYRLWLRQRTWRLPRPGCAPRRDRSRALSALRR